MCDRTSSHIKRNCKYCSHGHSGTFARNTVNAERTETDRRLHVNISHNTSHQTEGKHRYNGVRSRLRQWTSDVPDKPTHTTLGLRFHKNIAQPHQTKDNNRMCAVTGMAPVLDVESVQPKTNTNLRHVSNMANNETQNPHAPETLSPRVPDALETGVRDLARQTKTNMDHWRPTRWLRNHRERMLKLSLSLVAAPTTTLSNRDTPNRNTPFDTN